MQCIILSNIIFRPNSELLFSPSKEDFAKNAKAQQTGVTNLAPKVASAGKSAPPAPKAPPATKPAPPAPKAPPATKPAPPATKPAPPAPKVSPTTQSTGSGNTSLKRLSSGGSARGSRSGERPLVMFESEVNAPQRKFPVSQPAAEAKGSVAPSAESLPDVMPPGSHVEKTNQRAQSPRASTSSIDSGAVPSSPERTPTRPSSNNRYTPKQSPRYGIYVYYSLFILYPSLMTGNCLPQLP